MTHRGSAWKSQVVGNSAVQLVGPSDTRTALTITTSDQDLFLSPEASVSDGAGLRVVSGQAPIQICRCHVGDWLNRNIWAIAPGGNTTVYVIEGFEPWHDNQSR